MPHDMPTGANRSNNTETIGRNDAEPGVITGSRIGSGATHVFPVGEIRAGSPGAPTLTSTEFGGIAPDVLATDAGESRLDTLEAAGLSTTAGSSDDPLADELMAVGASHDRSPPPEHDERESLDADRPRSDDAEFKELFWERRLPAPRLPTPALKEALPGPERAALRVKPAEPPPIRPLDTRATTDVAPPMAIILDKRLEPVDPSSFDAT